MSRKKEAIDPSFAALVTQWEAVNADDKVEHVAARSSAMLSRVQDVPQTIVEALDLLMSDRYEGHATAIFDVVRFLRGLAAVEDLTQPSAPVTTTRTTAAKTKNS